MQNVGKYIVEMVKGILSKEAVTKWAWDRSDEGAACEFYIPTRDLKDINGFVP